MLKKKKNIDQKRIYGWVWPKGHESSLNDAERLSKSEGYDLSIELIRGMNEEEKTIKECIIY